MNLEKKPDAPRTLIHRFLVPTAVMSFAVMLIAGPVLAAANRVLRCISNRASQAAAQRRAELILRAICQPARAASGKASNHHGRASSRLTGRLRRWSNKKAGATTRCVCAQE
jgi:hypothetical protein